MNTFAIGQHVHHPKYGGCTVTFIGESRIGVVFDEGNDALFRMEDFVAEPPVSPEAPPPVSSPSWPESTFVAEADGGRHFMGSHWRPFFDDVQEIAVRLPEILPQARVLAGYGEFYPAPRQEPGEWAKGGHLAWPLPRQGLVATTRIDPENIQLMSLYPHFVDGIQVTLHLERVTVWESGVEAQIEATWGATDVCFFDTEFLVNRAWYEAGKEYDFILTGIAYQARPAQEMTMPYSPNPDQVAWERQLAESRDQPQPEVPDTIDLKGMAMWLPIDAWDVDDYQFRGPVKKVTPVDDALGQRGWRVQVTVMHFDDEDADLDVFITERAWEDSEPPLVGQDIEGELWLQGRLWSPGDWA